MERVKNPLCKGVSFCVAHVDQYRPVFTLKRLGFKPIGRALPFPFLTGEFLLLHPFLLRFHFATTYEVIVFGRPSDIDRLSGSMVLNSIEDRARAVRARFALGISDDRDRVLRQNPVAPCRPNCVLDLATLHRIKAASASTQSSDVPGGGVLKVEAVPMARRLPR